MHTLTVALLQMVPHGADRAANLATGEAFCREARAMGADIALFPEMWSNGYARFARRPPMPRATSGVRPVAGRRPAHRLTPS